MTTCIEIQYQFQLIRWKVHPKINKYHTEWLLVIEDEDAFKEYLKFRFNMLVKEYKKLKEKRYQFHCTSEDEFMIEVTFQASNENKDYPLRKTIVDDLVFMEEKLMCGYTHFYDRNNIIFITGNHAIRPFATRDFKVLRTINCDKIEWPHEKYTKKDIKVVKWPNGIHYYAKIGMVDVVDDYGNMKWLTAKEAEKCANKYLKTMRE